MARAASRIGDDLLPLLVRLEKYDHQFTGREPSALFERLKSAAGDQSRSVNEIRVAFQEVGTAAYEWLQGHAEQLKHVGFGSARYPDEIVLQLLDEALAAREKRKR